MLLHRRRGARVPLDVGRDMHRLDVVKADPSTVTPAEERNERPHVSHPGVLVPDVSGEELNEATTRLLPGGGDDHRQELKADTGQAAGFDADDLGAHGRLNPPS